jgi:hypothetical protein
MSAAVPTTEPVAGSSEANVAPERAGTPAPPTRRGRDRVERVLVVVGAQRHLGGEVEHAAHVGPRDVRDAAQRALPPELVVGELGDAVEVDRVHGHRSAAVDGVERAHHHVAARGERDRGVQRRGYRLVVGTRPDGAEC